MGPVEIIALPKGAIYEIFTTQSNFVNISSEQISTFAGWDVSMAPASPTLRLAVDVSLKAYKPEEAAIFFSRVQKRRAVWHHTDRSLLQAAPCTLYSSVVFTVLTL